MYNRIYFLRAFCLTFISVFLLSGCANYQVSVKHLARYQFSEVTTYSLFDRNSQYSQYQNLSDSLRNNIELALEKTLDNKGYQYKDNNHADVIISYYIAGYNRKNLAEYSQGVKYCDYCLTAVTTNNNGNIDSSPGYLLIDILDRETLRSVWRASAKLKFDRDDAVYEQQQKLREMIGNMLGNLADSQ